MSETDLGNCTPELHFSYLAAQTWRKRDGLTLGQIAAELERLRVAAKTAVGYWADNTHFIFDDLYGHAAVIFQVYADTPHVALWEANHGTWLGHFDDFPPDLAVWMNDHIAKGEVKCGECGQWIKEYVQYDFAGAVCQSCYDPKKHLPPDSR